MLGTAVTRLTALISSLLHSQMPVHLENRFTAPGTFSRASSRRSNPSYAQPLQHHTQRKSEPGVTKHIPPLLLVPVTPPRPTQHDNRSGLSSSMVRDGSVHGEAEAPVEPIAGNRAVRFDSVLKLILVPSRSDLGGLRSDLWYGEEDYLEFRYVEL